VNGPPKSGSIAENFSKERTWNFKIALVSSTMIIVEKVFFICFLNVHNDKWCWRFVNVRWNTSLSPQDMLIRSRRQFNSSIFHKVIMIVGWTISCHRNAVIFDGETISLNRWKNAFRDEFKLILHRTKTSTKILLSNWLSSF
jgi:hypothetical protein